MSVTSATTDRYSAVSSSSHSSTSSNYRYNNSTNPSLSQSSTFLPYSDAQTCSYLSKLSPNDYRSMQSLKQSHIYATEEDYSSKIARISPRIVPSSVTSLGQRQSTLSSSKDEHWLSCEALETIEKRFTDLLRQDVKQKKAHDYQPYDQRAKSCDRLALDDRDYHPRALKISTQHENEKQSTDEEYRSHSPSIISNKTSLSRSRSNQRKLILTNKDILKVESAYRSIGTQVFAARSLCDLYITTADRLAKLEDWIRFQHGLAVWVLNSGKNPQRPCRLSLVIAEYGSGFSLWEDTITGSSDVKQARGQHITFRLSDRITLAVLRFHNVSSSQEFFASYISIRNDARYQQLFNRKQTQNHHRSASCGSMLSKKSKSKRPLSKSSISNPCQFQHITSLQVKDRCRITSLENCLTSSPCYSNELL